MDSKKITGMACVLLISLQLFANENFDKARTANKNENYEEAITFYTKAAEQGHADAQFSLASFYYSGKGGNQNSELAVKWYTKAAEQGHADAQLHLGNIYSYGKTVAQNDELAVKWYKKAAEQGLARAQGALGNMYYGGFGAAQSTELAVKWYRKAAEQGHSNSQFYLGLAYKEGRGAPKDYGQAIKWFLEAAKLGQTDAQFHLGLMSIRGDGLPLNDELGVEWLTIAAEEGHADAQALLDRLYCIHNSETRLFDVLLKCASRESLRAAVKEAGALVKREDLNQLSDKYNSQSILEGSSNLNINYTVDGFFAKAEYTFPSNADATTVKKVHDFISRKYGKADYSSGQLSAREVSYKWYLNDGIELKVHRGWPNTTTYLSFIFPENYKNMVDEKERQREANLYKSQSNAF